MEQQTDVKKLKNIVVVSLFQSISLIYILFMKNLNYDLVVYEEIILNIFIVLNIIASIYNLKQLRDFDQLLKKFLSYQVIKAKVKEQKKFIDELRAQRHDFSNQLQTIGALAQLGKTEEIVNQVQLAGHDLAQLEYDNYNISTLELILKQKQSTAEKHNIKLDYQIEPGIENEKLSLNEIFRLFYNLIDNALEAAKKAENPKVVVKGQNNQDHYVVCVYNNGDFINDNLKKEIKKPGQSTKGTDRGYGVYIIQSLIDKADGKLEINSSPEDGTKFICYL